MSKITEKKFSKSMLVMLVSIMVGAVVITYFAADIVKQSKIDNLEGQIASKEEQIQIKEIEIIKEKNRNINFTNNFLKSAGVLDMAREYRANGSFHFELGRLFYTTALSETNKTVFSSYRNSTIMNCSLSMPTYFKSYNNFKISGYLFNKTKNYTNYDLHYKLINNYVNLTDSGAKLTLLMYNASMYLKYLAENLTMDEKGKVGFDENVEEEVKELWDLYNQTIDTAKDVEDEYNGDSDSIDQVKPEDIEDLEYPGKPDFNIYR